MEFEIPKDLSYYERPLISLILPCNSYARYGNYYLGAVWKRAVKSIIKSGINPKNVMLTAVDCIIVAEDPSSDKNTKGAIVFGTLEDMKRVKGYNVYPSWKRFKKNNYKFLYEMVEGIKIGLNRLLKEANPDLIVSVLNVLGYKLAFYKAVEELDLWDKVLFIDIPPTPAYIWKGIKLAVEYIKEFLSGSKNSGIVMTQESMGWYSARKSTIPEGFEISESDRVTIIEGY